MTLNVTEFFDLTASVTPAGACDKSVTWTSSNGAVAYLDANGYVTALASGTSTITGTKSAKLNMNYSSLNEANSIDEEVNTKYIKQHAKIYPNPASGNSVMIQLPLEIEMIISVYDLRGRFVNQINSADDFIEIPIEKMLPGVYIVSMKAENLNWQQKLIIR